MSQVPGLRSPYVKVGRIVYFGRMLDKIRLNAAGKLPPAEYGANLGKGFDGRCCTFLRVGYDDLKAKVLAGGSTDEQLLGWAEQQGGRRTDDECEIWNGFMIKRGWRDAGASTLAQRIRENGFEAKNVQSMFDYIDYDEGRDPVAERSWEKV
jgi:hypothetical protein